MIRSFFFLALSCVSFTLGPGEDFCGGVRNTTFDAGESVTFSVYYTMAGIYVYGGDAVFSVNLERMSGRPVYHVVGDGKTNSFFDSFFKVRDRYESYIDTATLKPLRFIRNINEGNFSQYDNVTFNEGSNTVTTNKGLYTVPPCVQDVLSAVYYARNIDYDKYQPGDKIPFNMFLDNQTYNLYIRYLGKETIKTRYGKFRAIKFKPLLIQGTMFRGGEGMTVWVSDDADHLPVRIESPIVVGTIKVDMTDCKHLRHPLTGLVCRR